MGEAAPTTPTAPLPQQPTTSRAGPAVPAWVGPSFVVLAGLMIPWNTYLALTLPSRQVAHHYDVAWVGYDVALMLALLATGVAAWRRASWLGVTAAVAATLLVVDAWFDVVSSVGVGALEALLLAVAVELPLAALCLWLSVHSEQVVASQLSLLRRTRRHP
jgi:hypothetical protein